jgi:hypothetical protein
MSLLPAGRPALHVAAAAAVVVVLLLAASKHESVSTALRQRHDGAAMREPAPSPSPAPYRYAGPYAAMLADSVGAPPWPREGLAVTTDARYAAPNWDASWAPSPHAWFKLDFVVPLCMVPACGCAFTFATFQAASEEGKAAMAFGDVAGVPAALGARSFRLEDAVAVLRSGGYVQAGEQPEAGGAATGAPPAAADYREFVVNVGAACALGGRGDPTWGVLVSSPRMGALLLDGQNNGGLFDKYPLQRPGVEVMGGVIIDPATVAALLRERGVPANFTVLKVDIDSYDLAVTTAVLDGGA